MSAGLSPAPSRAGRLPLARWGALVLALAVVAIAGCSSLIETAPTPTPLDFPGIAGELAKHGITIGDWKSGDAGCTDPTLIPTAVGFDAAGLDEKQRTRVRVYIFRDVATYQRRRADVDTCATSWATDPATFEFVDAPPFVIAGQGPWPPEFHAAIRAALTAAAGHGG